LSGIHPMYMVDSLTKNMFASIKISKIGAMLIFLAGFAGLNKDPAVWLHGARPDRDNIFAQSNNAFG
jgi:hypothetical protein